MIRVLHVVARLNVGGPARLLAQLAADDRVDVHVAAGTVGAGEHELLAVSDLPQGHGVPGLGRRVHAADDLRALAHLDRLIRRLRPDVVHTHTAKAGALGRVAARRAGVPAIHTFHGHLLTGYHRPAVTRAVVATERGLARWSAALVAVGTRVRDELLAAGVGTRTRFEVIRPGIEPLPRIDKDEARRALAIPADAHVVSYVGRLAAVKRPDRLAEVARLVLAADDRAVFVVAGDGEGMVHLRPLEGPRMRLLGWTDDITTVHAASDVAVLTSDNEGIPLGLIEAATLGVPAVAPDVGAVGDLVVDGVSGCLVGVPASAVHLAGAVGRLLDDPAGRGLLGGGALRRASDVNSTAGMRDRHRELYEQVLPQFS